MTLCVWDERFRRPPARGVRARRRALASGSSPERWSGRGPLQRAARAGDHGASAASSEPAARRILARDGGEAEIEAARSGAACCPAAASRAATRCWRRSATPTRRCCGALRTRGHAEPVETMMQAIGMCGEYAAVWAVAGAVGASIDDKRRRQWLAGGATGPLAVGDQLRRQGRGRPQAAADRGPSGARQGALEALVPLGPRDLVGRRGDRARQGRAPRPPGAVHARRRDLRRPPLPRHALPLRRARRRRRSAPRSARSSPGSATRRPRSACSSSPSARTSARSRNGEPNAARIA